jgi:glycosyltransferase involved in cell wall biosynthesis
MNIQIPVLAMTAHGGGRVLVEVANYLVDKGNEVSIITSKYSEKMPFIFDERIKVVKIGPNSKNKSFCALSYMVLSPFYMRKSLILANHFLTVIPSWLAILMSSRYVYLVQDIEERFFTKPSQWLFRALCRWTYKQGRIISANAYLTSQLKGYNEILLTLNLGISNKFIDQINKDANKKKYDVIYFLRAQPHKRLDRFEKILKKLEKSNLSVLCVSQDLELLSKYNERVNILKPKDDFELIAAIDSAKIILLTSEHEGFALPPLECMARGLPAVLYECGGPSIYAKDGYNSYVIQSDADEDKSAEFVFDRIKSLLSNDKLYSQMSSNARDTSLNYRLDDAVIEFVNFLGENYQVKF